MKHQNFVKPVITEKSMGLAATSWYSFRVDPDLSKPEIAGMIENQFKVHVMRIKTIHVKSKLKHSGRKRTVSETGDWKKAIVKLKDNEKIDLFSVEEKTVAKP